MRAILTNWNFLRILRLVLGGVILVQGIMAKDFVSILFGVFFAGTAVVNVGCCGSGCSVNYRSQTKVKNDSL